MTDLERRPGGLDVIRAQFNVPGATDTEIAYFLRVARHENLDPWAGQVALVGRYDRKANQTVYRPQVTVAGRRAIAERTGRYAGMDGPEWTGPRGPAGDLDWREVWDDDDNYPYAARCYVYRHDWTRPANGTVKWSEFAQYLDAERKRLNPIWARMGSHMLGKVAESLALRRAFPEVAAAVEYVGDDDDNTIAEAEATPPPAITASHPSNPPRTVTAARAAYVERVPDHVYDNAPESQGVDVEHAYRYDDPGRPFTTDNPGARFTD